MTGTSFENTNDHHHHHHKENSKWRRTGIPPDGFTIEPADGNYSWIVLLGCCLSFMALANGFITFGILLNDIVLYYGTTVSTITWATSIAMAISYFSGPLVPMMTQAYSCRKTAILGGLLAAVGASAIYFTNSIPMFLAIYGICSGIGTGLCYPTYSIVLSQYFKKYFGIATGLLLASSGCSKIILAPVIEYFREEYGCRQTMLIAGAITLNCCVGAAVFQPSKWHDILVPIDSNKDNLETNSHDGTEETKTRSESINDSQHSGNSYKDIVARKERTMSVITVDFGSTINVGGNVKNQSDSNKKRGFFSAIDKSLLKEPMFYLASCSNFIMVVTLLYTAFFSYSFGLDMGLEPMQSAFAVSIRGIGEIIGRGLGPIILSYLKYSARISSATLYAVHGIILILLLNANSTTNFMVIGVLSGLVFGFCVGLNGQLIMKYVGRERLPSFLGLSAFAQGIVIIPFGPFIGWVHDTTGSYSAVFLILGGLQFVLSFIWILKPYVPQLKPLNSVK